VGKRRGGGGSEGRGEKRGGWQKRERGGGEVGEGGGGEVKKKNKKWVKMDGHPCA